MAELDYFKPYNDLTKFIPKNLRNPVNQALLKNLFNRFMTRDESVPLFGFIGKKPAEGGTSKVPQLTVERDINSIVPVISFKQGAETVYFTVEDLLNRAKVLGINTDDLGWLYNQGNNFVPPIDIDRFTNFFNYYWVAQALPNPPQPNWNPELLPEYYTIERPAASAIDKLNVVACTATGDTIQLTGTGFLDQIFDITFTSPTTFTITPQNPLVGPPLGGSNTYTPVNQGPWQLTSYNQLIEYYVTGPQGTFKLVEFRIIRDQYDSPIFGTTYASFVAGDKFTLSAKFLSSNYSVNFTGTADVKGKLTNVKTLNQYQTVDGVLLKEGDRVLVAGPSAVSGIYNVGPQAWSRATDFAAATAAPAARVFVTGGLQNGGKVFTSAGALGSFTWADTGERQSNTSDWQEGNYWVSRSELARLGLDTTKAIQATRPIIQYSSGLQLNKHVVAGKPADTVGQGNYKQYKSEFNQLPLFDLFRYDGTHSGFVSSVFFYVEDQTAQLDVNLQKRVKRSTNESADFIFDHGCIDEAGQLLFVKVNSALKTVWHAGYSQAELVDQATAGAGNGTATSITVNELTQQLIWTLTATSATTFSIASSKTVEFPPAKATCTVGVPYSNELISFTVTQGSVPFQAGDKIYIRVGNLSRPRYMFRHTDDTLQDLYGGAAADVNKVGAYQLPKSFINNPYNSAGDETTEGPLYSHFRSILSAAPAPLPLNHAFGGNIKLWSEQHTLLAGLLMQKDVTITSMIDMAKSQYEAGLNTIRDIYIQSIVEYLAQEAPVTTESQLTALLDFILDIRSRDMDVKTVLYDGTSGVPGIPATLPQLGLAQLVEPAIVYDRVINQQLLQHHDGHLTQLYVDSYEFKDTILTNYAGKLVARSDGTSTPAVGSFTSTPPARPYKGELWYYGGVLSSFAVNYDSGSAPEPAKQGELWYNRQQNKLYLREGFSWVEQSTVTAAWKPIDLASILNDLMFIVEQRLYTKINPLQRKFDFTALTQEPEFYVELERELATYAALNNLNPLSPNYTASDAFTWNYSQSPLQYFAPLGGLTQVPGRWHKALVAHQAAVGVIPTERPNIEPWKLFGFPTPEQWWSSLSAAKQQAYTPALKPSDVAGWSTVSVVRVVEAEGTYSLQGLRAVDGVQLAAGDLVLVKMPFNPAVDGVWKASAGNWTQVSLPQQGLIEVSEGNKLQRTTWGTTSGSVNIVRAWSTELWTDIMQLHPQLKISVNPLTDELLPPYVGVTSPLAQYALTSYIPAGVALDFKFGESSPVEEVWVRTVEYGYAKAKALGRYDPLALLGFCWGFNWVEVDNILYDGFNMNVPSHKTLKLHGESINQIDRSKSLELLRSQLSYAGSTVLRLSYDAYGDNRQQIFSVRDAAGVMVGAVVVNGPAVNAGGAANLQLKDYGQPFRIGDSFEIQPGGQVSFIGATTHSYLGLGQTFTNALRKASISSGTSYADSALRKWDVNMGYRAGGLVTTDDLKISTETDELNPASYALTIKKNSFARDTWLQALRITVFQTGKVQLSSSSYTNIPAEDGSDWVFRIEGYNPRYSTISYYELETPAAGIKFPATASIGTVFFRHDVGATFQFTGTSWQEVANADVLTFNALNSAHTDLVWYTALKKVRLTTAQLPLQITGLQNVVNFLAGYEAKLNEDGWSFNVDNEFSTDPDTGLYRSWNLEAQKLIDTVYTGVQLGQGRVINPFADRVWLTHKTGLLAEFADSQIFDVTGDAAVFDALGIKFQSSDITVIRTNEYSSIAPAAPMFSLHAQVDEYEHLLVFQNYVQPSTQHGLLYHPFSGSRVISYLVNGRQQGTKTLRPDLGGYYIVNNEVRRNLQASTDALNSAYSANQAFEDATLSRNALALLGFSKKPYFDNLNLSDKTQFNFWRGMIHSKGTNMSMDAYLNSNNFKEARVDEFWAYKVAEYGDARTVSFPELKINIDDCLQKYTLLQFDATVGIQNFIQVSSMDESRWYDIDDLNQDVSFKAEVVGTYKRVFE